MDTIGEPTRIDDPVSKTNEKSGSSSKTTDCYAETNMFNDNNDNDNNDDDMFFDAAEK
jgi:hypothetical protein